MKLTGNTILITGGTSGIGLELGKSLIKRKNTVILLGRNQEKLTQLSEQGFKTIYCDLSKQEEIEQAVIAIQNEYPNLNILFNNAGVQFNYLFTETVIPISKISREVEINLTGQLLLTQLLIPILSNAPKALIVNTTSGLGAFPKMDGLVYSASKAAMRSFTKGLRLFLKSTNINVVEFIPPVTDTAMTSGRSEKKMGAEQLVLAVLPQIEKERKTATVPAMRFFLLISFLFPKLAHSILSNK